jgi:hypothetical protein
VSSVVGIIGAAVSLINFLHFARPGPDLLTLLAEHVQRIEITLSSLFEWNTAAHWNQVLANLESTLSALNNYLDGTATPGSNRSGLLSDDDRKRLFDNVLIPLRTTRFTLLPTAAGEPSAFQQSRFKFTNLIPLFNEGLYHVRMDPLAVGIIGLPAVEPVEWTGEFGQHEGFLMWDYRRVLPHLIRTLAALITCFKLYDPAFRTTGRFQKDLSELITDLEIFAARWMSCLCWSKLRPISSEFPDSDFPYIHHPIAFDSRAWISYGRFDDAHPDYWEPMPDEPEYSQKRQLFAQKVILFSGFRDFWNAINELRKLTTTPDTSETVFLTTSATGPRSFVRKDTIQRGGGRQIVKFYHVDWTIDVEMTLQPQNPPYDYAAGHPIRYEFFLESYSDNPKTAVYPPRHLLQRIGPLSAGRNRRVTMLVQNPTLYIAGEDDGTYGDPLPPNRKAVLRTPVATSQPSRQFTPVNDPSMTISKLNGLVKAAGIKGTKVDLENKMLNAAMQAVLVLNGIEWASEPPTRTQFLFEQGNPTECTFGYSLGFPPKGDIRDGAASFQCWNIDNQAVNVGALYLVVEEIPPGTDRTRIKTAAMLPLNPNEIWYPGYIFRDPQYIVS